jgi:CO dehydrogenase/acetyl-CoA synthase alpha subunit
VDYKRAKALAVIIEVDNHMPVQIDKIAEFLEEKREEFNLKLYGFCHTNVSLGIFLYN